jgi:hypothetical protein
VRRGWIEGESGIRSASEGVEGFLEGGEVGVGVGALRQAEGLGRFGFGGAQFGGDEFIEVAEFEGFGADEDGLEVRGRIQVEIGGTDLGGEDGRVGGGGR